MPRVCSAGPMGELRIGLIGGGMVAAHHARAWERAPRARLVAIADPDVEAATRLAGGTLPVFSDLTALLAGTEVDAIDIATPVGTHAALVTEALAAGVPVLCQKPLAPTAREAHDLVAALPARPRAMLHENWRWRPSFRALHQSLSGGPRPRRFEMRVESSGLCPDARGVCPALVRQPFLADLEHLLVFEILGHHLDVLSFLFGPVEILSAETRRRSDAVRGEDFARIELRAGGIDGRLTGDLMVADAPPRPRDRVMLDGRTVLFDWRLDLPGGLHAWDHDAGYQQSFDDCIGHFAARLQDGAPFETPLDHGLTLLEQIERVYALA